MPAKKPASLITKHDIKAIRKKRADGEAALKPKVELLLKPPVRLASHRGAGALWRRMIKMYRGLDAEIISRLDQDMLVAYCILDVQADEMDKLRTAAMKNYDKAQRNLDRKAEKDEVDPKLLIRWQDSVNWSMGVIIKLDARVDRKQALLHVLRQSLYLTPRSRAGVRRRPRSQRSQRGTWKNCSTEYEQCSMRPRPCVQSSSSNS